MLLINRGLLFRSARDPLSRYVCFNFSCGFLATLDSWSNAAALRFYSPISSPVGPPSLFSYVCLFFFDLPKMKNGGGDRMITPEPHLISFLLSFPVHPRTRFTLLWASWVEGVFRLSQQCDGPALLNAQLSVIKWPGYVVAITQSSPRCPLFYTDNIHGKYYKVTPPSSLSPLTCQMLNVTRRKSWNNSSSRLKSSWCYPTWQL